MEIERYLLINICGKVWGISSTVNNLIRGKYSLVCVYKVRERKKALRKEIKLKEGNET